jgi:hypothetical protein
MEHAEFKQFIMEGDEFWADKVKRLNKTEQTGAVVELCKRKLPLPAAFTCLAVALRRQIASQKKQSSDYEAQLKELYELAVYERFLHATPTVTLGKDASPIPEGRVFPAYNVAEIAHFDGVRIRLSSRYDHHGYRYLSLLNKTDIKLMIRRWGEPHHHQDPRQEYSALWSKYVSQFEQKIVHDSQNWIASLQLRNQ